MKGLATNDRHSPLPHRTGHGDFPHPALARNVSSRRHSQWNQSQMSQVSIQADALSNTPTPLTATSQVSPQSRPHEMIELPKRLPRIAEAETLRPARQMSVQPPNQLRQRSMTLLRIDHRP